MVSSCATDRSSKARRQIGRAYAFSSTSIRRNGNLSYLIIAVVNLVPLRSSDMCIHLLC